MQDWLPELRGWALLAFMVLVPFIGWTIRTGLAPRREVEDRFAKEAETRRAADAALEAKVADKLADLDRRTLRIETEVRHLPTREDIAAVQAQLATVKAQGEQTSKQVDKVAATVGNIENFLLNSKAMQKG